MSVSSALKFGFQFVSPSFYAAKYSSLVQSLHKQFKAGSVAPLFKGFLLVGVVGYTAEYIGYTSEDLSVTIFVAHV